MDIWISESTFTDTGEYKTNHSTLQGYNMAHNSWTASLQKRNEFIAHA